MQLAQPAGLALAIKIDSERPTMRTPDETTRPFHFMLIMQGKKLDFLPAKYKHLQ